MSKQTNKEPNKLFPFFNIFSENFFFTCANHCIACHVKAINAFPWCGFLNCFQEQDVGSYKGLLVISRYEEHKTLKMYFLPVLNLRIGGFWNFESKKKSLSQWKLVTNYVIEGWDSILMFSWVSANSLLCLILRYTVYLC